MAEGTLFSIASRLLSLTASQSHRRAFRRWGASEELDKIGRTIETIQAVLLDAEKHREQSPAVNNLMERLRNVFYDTEDLFDEVATDDLLYKQQLKGGTIARKVRLFFSNPNALASSFALNVRLKAIRKTLDEVCKDAAHFNFVRRPYEEPTAGIRKGVGTGWFSDQNLVVGRNHDMESILGTLFNEAHAKEYVSIIAIVGIGGIGKTTLAQLVYNNEEVQKNFEARWWACVSNMFDEAEIIRSIFKPVVGESCHDLSLSQLETRIRESVSMNEKFLLVIDDLKVEHDFIAQNLRSLLTSDYTRGNKIIVTTSSLTVARAINADIIHELMGLSWDASWELFRRIAFTREQENDLTWNSLGRKVLRKCPNAPLAIKSLACLLYTKPSKEEWKSTLDFLQPGAGDGSIMPVLKLSYDNLPSDLKRCFSYCSLFPKDFKFHKDTLIRLWIAQGYITTKNDETLEAVGDAIFKELLRRFFFRVEEKDENGEATCCKMHDLIHDLAVFVAEQGSFVLTEGLDQFHQPIRHFSVGFKIDGSWEIPPSLPTSGRLRSFLFTGEGLLSPLALEQLLKRFKFLRVLDLQHQNLVEVPSSVGDLLHLRYLNLSGNNFRNLPNSVTKLVHLHTLDISSCVQLELLPVEMTKLISLRHFVNDNCDGLRYMPPRFGKLTSLQHLSYFKVGKIISGVNSSRLDALGGLKLRGKLQIMFDKDIDNWDEDECWKLPTTLQWIEICSYPGRRIPFWEQKTLLPKLVRVNLYNSSTIKYLSSLRHLPYLKALRLSSLNQLTYVEEEEDEHESRQCAQLAAGYSLLFFPCLEELELTDMPRLMGWSREVEAVTTSKYIAEEAHSSCRDPPDQMPSFPLLSNLKIEKCPMLKSLPPSPCLRTLELQMITEELIQHLLSTCSHSPETIAICKSDSLDSFSSEALTSLRHLELSSCNHDSLYLNISEKSVDRNSEQMSVHLGMSKSSDVDTMSQYSSLYHHERTYSSHSGEEGSSGTVKKQSSSSYGLASASPLVGLPEMSRLGWGHWFTLRDIEVATNHFSSENIIGEGLYGVVYKGRLINGTEVAVKRILKSLGLAEREFRVEVEAIGHVQHKNLVRLLGYCVEGVHRLLIYEYVSNGNLDQWLHGGMCQYGVLTWEARIKVLLGTAKALSYLHESIEPKAIHRDIKPSNILIGTDFNSKLSDFGLAKLLDSGSYINTRVMDTFGYVAPEYATSGLLDEKSDIYSFGVLLLEAITGRDPVNYSRPANEVELVVWLRMMVGNRRAEEVVDPDIKAKPTVRALKRALLVALRCIDPDPQKRPKMSQVVRMLEADEFPQA